MTNPGQPSDVPIPESADAFKERLEKEKDEIFVAKKKRDHIPSSREQAENPSLLQGSKASRKRLKTKRGNG